MVTRRKNILITAGPTWVSLDQVRVISNIASGKTGILLAKEFASRQANVTLLLGPVGDCRLPARVRVLRFRYFYELQKSIKEELQKKQYDVIIHSAAVSDFRPRNTIQGKIKSDQKRVITLVPLPKIASDIKSGNPQAVLVIFKLEIHVSDRLLIQRARRALHVYGAQIVVANSLNPYHAFIIDRAGSMILVRDKESLAKRLMKIITQL